MNKFGFIVALAICSFASTYADTCPSGSIQYFKDNAFSDMQDKCSEETGKQIKMEITASLKYLGMATHFAKDSVNRPGFAKLFFDAASEEREHAYKLIEYLTMRGRYLDNAGINKEIAKIDISSMVTKLATPDAGITSGLVALQKALELEKEVTTSIRNLIATCEGTTAQPFNHYHFVDYLTGDFLEEQYKGQRDLAGKISTLGKLAEANGAELGDFLFDKELL